MKVKNSMKVKNRKKERKPLELPLKIIWLVRYFVEFVFNYSLIMASCVSILPLLLITLGSYVGVSYDSNIIDVLVLFALPALFLVGIYIIIYFFVMRQIHRGLNKMYDKITVKYRAIGKDDEKND